MTTRQLSALALKVFAIYVAIKGLLVLPPTVAALHSTWSSDSPREGYWAIIALEIFLFALILVFAYYFWGLARRILEEAAPDHSSERIPDLEGFILSVLGLFLLVQALVRIIYSTTGVYVQATSSNYPNGVAPQTVAYFVGYVVQFLVGLTLIIRTAGWIRLLRHLRQAG